ncbi:MAG: alpha-hydroxy-acid oxidizing protein [Oscillochloris sp.]|nr:alpha-hydroxy-acid oxidizing protein [Oscillochloris sp.]
MDALNLFDLEVQARAHLSPSTWAYYAGGAEDELSVHENRAAWQRIRLRPRILVDCRERRLETLLFQQALSFPLVLAPTSHQRLAHPDGEIATVRAAAAAGILAVLGTGNHFSVEEVAAASDGAPFWFQLYCYEPFSVTAQVVRRAEAAGARALVLTVDACYAPRRESLERSGFRLTSDVRLGNLRGVGLRDDALTAEGGVTPAFLAGLQLSPLGWADIARLRDLSPLPLLLKGVLTAEDALLALAHGIDGLIVSNHGARQIDGTQAAIDALPAIAAAVGGRIPLLVDGGVRRGTDIVKALALGASAVLIGRPYLWGLALAGESGVRFVIEQLRHEFDSALAQLGRPVAANLSRDTVLSKHCVHCGR